MIGRDLDADDGHSVRIGYPHLPQPPELLPRLPDDRHAGLLELPLGGSDVPDLQPEADRPVGRAGRRAGTADLQEGRSEEEDRAGMLRWPELPCDGEAQHVPVETAAGGGIAGTQEDSAAEDLHGCRSPQEAVGAPALLSGLSHIMAVSACSASSTRCPSWAAVPGSSAIQRSIAARRSAVVVTAASRGVAPSAGPTRSATTSCSACSSARKVESATRSRPG